MTKLNTFPTSWIDSTVMEYEREQQEKDRRPLTEKDDPLALSWASYGVWKRRGARWVDLKEVEAHAHDREMAAISRKYYRDRYTMEVLKGKQLTEFQTVVYGIVSGEQPILQDQLGVLMKIPYFYVEDIGLQEIFKKTKSLSKKEFVAETREDIITPVGYTFASRKRFETHQYWFADSQGRTTSWMALTSNPLASVVKSLYERGQAIKIRANWHYATRQGPHRDHVHWNLANVELI